MKMTKLAKGKEQREAFVSSQIDVGIPFQIRALRKKRGMDQNALAQATGMAQPRISAIESPGYASFTIDTLKRVAAAFDVALIVRFGAFGELVEQSNNFSPDEFEIPSFNEELTNSARIDANSTANNVVPITMNNFRVVIKGPKIWAGNDEITQQTATTITPTYETATGTRQFAEV